MNVNFLDWVYYFHKFENFTFWFKISGVIILRGTGITVCVNEKQANQQTYFLKQIEYFIKIRSILPFKKPPKLLNFSK